VLEKLSIRILVSVVALAALIGEGPFFRPLLKDAGAAPSSQIQYAQAGPQAAPSGSAIPQPEPAIPAGSFGPKDAQSGEAASQTESDNAQPEQAAAQPEQPAAQPQQAADSQEPAKVQPAGQGAGADPGTAVRRGRRPSVMPRRPSAIMEQPATPALTQSQGGSPLPATAQAGNAAQPAATQQNPAAQTMMQSRMAAMAGGQVTLNFDDADVYTIIQTIFGDVLRLNYIVDPRVKGRVTFRSVAPVPRDKVLPMMEVVMRLNGIAIVEDSGLYRIVPIADIAKEPAPLSQGRDPEKIRTEGKSILQVIPITYISSSEALRLMAPFLSQNALVVDVPKGNKIIIVDTDANVKRLLRLLEVFDNEGVKQKKSKIFVYHCQNGKAKDIASTLQQVFLNAKASGTSTDSSPAGKSAALPLTPQGAAPSIQSQRSTAPGASDQLVAESTRIFSDDILNAVIVMATPEDYELIQETLVRVDIAQRQVMIEGLIAEVTLKDNLDIQLSGLIKASIGSFNLDLALNPGNLKFDGSSPSTSGFTMVGTDSAGRVRALVTALATESKAKVLASPHVLVSDNREAKIQIGQQVPITTSETYGAVGVAPQRMVQYKDIGIILKVKPRVNEGGLVAMEVGQEVSTFQTIPLGNIGETQIIINKTEANTSLVVQDGQSIVIGGLIREDTSNTRSGIPLLSRIPILGWLFGNTSKEKQRTELIILLTPHVMKNQVDATKVTSGYVEGMIKNSEGRIKKEEMIKKEAAN